MPADDYKDIRRDGFVYGLGRFQAEPGPMDRVEGARLRGMFLPKLSREGQKAIRDNLSFVRCQLNHYGVQFEEEILWQWNCIDEESPPRRKVRPGPCPHSGTATQNARGMARPTYPRAALDPTWLRYRKVLLVFWPT